MIAEKIAEDYALLSDAIVINMYLHYAMTGMKYQNLPVWHFEHMWEVMHDIEDAIDFYLDDVEAITKDVEEVLG